MKSKLLEEKISLSMRKEMLRDLFHWERGFLFEGSKLCCATTLYAYLHLSLHVFFVFVLCCVSAGFNQLAWWRRSKL